MGKLTDDMTLLRGEVDRLRQEREEFMHGLRRSTSDLARGVKQMLNAFREANMENARRMQADLKRFTSTLAKDVAGIRENVDAMRDANVTDLAGARKAWFGSSRAGEPAVNAGKRRARGAKRAR